MRSLTINPLAERRGTLLRVEDLASRAPPGAPDDRPDEHLPLLPREEKITRLRLLKAIDEGGLERKHGRHTLRRAVMPAAAPQMASQPGTTPDRT